MRFYVVAFILLLSISANAQTNSIQDACKTVGMDCGYNSRHNLIDTVYKASGQVLFDKQSNPYTKDLKDNILTELPRYYIGTAEQNAKLARNILANRGLFQNGKLSPTTAKKWKTVK